MNYLVEKGGCIENEMRMEVLVAPRAPCDGGSRTDGRHNFLVEPM